MKTWDICSGKTKASPEWKWTSNETETNKQDTYSRENMDLKNKTFCYFYMCYMCFCQYHWYEVIFHWFCLHFPDYKGCRTLVCFHFGVTSVFFRVLLWTLCLEGIRWPCVFLGSEFVLTVCKTNTLTIVLLLQTWQHFSIYILTIYISSLRNFLLISSHFLMSLILLFFLILQVLFKSLSD